jgi:methylated-DNA-[protein]-cysteine S-methyltransferase
MISQTPSAIISSPIGKIAIFNDSTHIYQIRFAPEAKQEIAPQDALAETATKQLTAYFNDPLYQFNLPLIMHGTDFQKRVWQGLQQIPSGKTLTYGELAAQIGSHARAIGMGCRTNPLLIVVPCHRVVARNGLGGFMGTTTDGLQLDTKKLLLAHENYKFN